jgi:hypothetical protein
MAAATAVAPLADTSQEVVAEVAAMEAMVAEVDAVAIVVEVDAVAMAVKPFTFPTM